MSKAETPEQIAARIVDERLDEMMSPHQYASTRGLLIIDIVQALRNERERAAGAADKYVADMQSVPKRTEYGEGCLNAAAYLAKAIREGR